MGKIKKQSCPICNGLQKKGKTTYSVDLGFGVVVIRQVPALVCEVCGESFIEDIIAEALEKIVDQARQRQRMVEVVQYDKEAHYHLAS